MAPKTHRTGALKSHNRSASAGSSKIGLNLHFTQKDPSRPPSRFQDRAKKGGSSTQLDHQYDDAQYSSTRLNGQARGSSKDLQRLHAKRTGPPATTAARKFEQTAKVDFTISGSAKTDDDEWVSSDSGAVTPVHDADHKEAGSPPTVIEHEQPLPPQDSEHPGTGITPRAEAPVHLVRIDTARPTETPSPRFQLTQSTPTLVAFSTSPPRSRSELPSPSAKRPADAKRPSIIRRISHDSKVEMPPHPLIRGQSYNAPLKPSSLAPITVNSEAALAHMTGSPPETRMSPLIAMTPSSSRSSRRLSISSAHSVATLPALVSSRTTIFQPRDRMRTLSTISNSSTSAALSSLNALPVLSRPGSPPLTVHFPPEPQYNLDGSHPLLPIPYNAPHLTIVAYRSPLNESLERVLRVKPQTRLGQ